MSASTPSIPVGPSTVLPEVAFAVDTNSLKSLFMDAGVPFPVGSSIVYHEHSSTIIVHNTPENLETFERVLDVFNSTPPQVEIEAKFVQISQNDLDELGFDWQVGTKTLGSFDVSGGNAVGGFPPGPRPRAPSPRMSPPACAATRPFKETRLIRCWPLPGSARFPRRRIKSPPFAAF